MRLNLLALHNPREDRNLRQCLRAYSVLPEYCENPNHKNEKAVEINRILKKVNSRLKKEVGPRWRKKWEEEIGYPIKKRVSEEWIRGRAAIPLVAIDALKILGCEKEVEEIIDKVEYVSSTTGEVVRIPNELTPDILYLAGLVLGDGSLPIKFRRHENNFEYEVLITSRERQFLEKEIIPLFKTIFGVESVSMRFSGHIGKAWTMCKKNKAIFRFFTQIIKLPKGDKSTKAEVPTSIKEMNPGEFAPFLAGLIDSDIGKHSSGMGSTFKSKKLVEELITLLGKAGIIAKHYGSHYKNNKYLQHDFSIPKSQIIKLKDLLEETYLPKRKDRLNTLYSLLGMQECERGQIGWLQEPVA